MDCMFADMNVVNEKQLGLISEFTICCKLCSKTDKITTYIHGGSESVLNINRKLNLYGVAILELNVRS